MPRTPKKLSTFILTENGDNVSPVFTTFREFGRWMSVVYDEYTCNYHLYDKLEGDSLAQYYPYSKLNKYLDSLESLEHSLQSWYVSQSSNIVTSIIRLHIAAMEDCMTVKTTQGVKRMLRLYPVESIQKYIVDNVDPNFNIMTKVHPPASIPIQPIDHNFMEIPKKGEKTVLDMTLNNIQHRKIFDSTKVVKLTLSQIERELGYRVELLPE